jgi:hypothetical protein
MDSHLPGARPSGAARPKRLSCRFVEPFQGSNLLLCHIKNILSHSENIFFIWRRDRDSNPGRGLPSTVFKTAAFDRSAISPKTFIFMPPETGIDSHHPWRSPFGRCASKTAFLPFCRPWEGVTLNGFQDRRFRPLSHLSSSVQM